MATSKWIVKQRDYELDVVKYQAKLTSIMRDQDPLNADVITLPVKKKIIKKGNITMRRADYNPLENGISNIKKKDNKTSTPTSSAAPVVAQGVSKSGIIPTLPKNVKIVDDFKYLSYSLIINKNFTENDSMDITWACIKKNLMDLFCNNFNMEVKSIYSFSLDEEDLEKKYKIEGGRCRLEELEGDKKGGNYNIISSGEYVAKMEVLKREMLQKWEVEDKVGTLKIIIHCMKMLNDVFTPKFYTHKFLIISDILDNFAKLVYERIFKLSFGDRNQADFNNINPTIGSQTARDICSNWILKCACIRELLPRIYIDISFLRIFKFILTEKEIEQKIIIVSKMIRGLSHPLIAFYVSMYLSRVALSLYPKNRSFLLILLSNLSKFKLDEDLIKRLGYDNITIDEMKKVLEPCVEWIVYCTSKNMQLKEFTNLMKVYDQSKDFFILKSIIIHAPVKFIFTPEYLEYIFSCSELYDFNDGVFLYMLVCHKILNSNSPIESKYITQMWDKIRKSKSKGIFIDCCGLLGEILIKFHSEDMQDKFFEEVFDIFKTTITNSSSVDDSMSQANYYSKFEIFLYSILTKINNYSNILNADNFLYLLENFNADIKLNICHTILAQIIDSNDKIKDPYLAFSLLKIGKYIHDSVELFSQESKKKEVAEILINFIRKVDFGIDYENLLNFLTDARGYYSDLEDVIEMLIIEVQKIAIQTYRFVKGKHNKKTIRFCKVCVAYCQITIPSLKSPHSQLKFLLTTAEIALMNNLISECDSLVKNILTIISKIITDQKFEKTDFDFIVSYFKSLMGFLVVVPSNPESPFQLITGMVNLFTQSSNLLVKRIKLHSYLSVIKYLTTQLQMKLPYHIANIDSNDEIFTSDPNFKEEGLQLIESSISEIFLEISDYESKLTSFDYDEFDFLLNYCFLCIENLKIYFEPTKYYLTYQKKLIELCKKYIEVLKKNVAMKAKIEKYVNQLGNISID